MIKLMQLLSELNINKPVRTWDFSKHIPNFDPLKMRKGDKLVNYIDGINLIFDKIDGNAINSYSEKNNNKVILNLNQMVLDNRNRKYGIRELQISQPTINIDGQYGDITIITNGPLAGKEVELLMTDEGDEYKLTFSDVNKDYIGLDLHDYVMFIKWLKAQRIKFTAKAWEIGSYLEPDDMSDDSIDGIDVFIPEQYIKFL